MIPVMEPSNQQEAYDMVHYAFDLSEECSCRYCFAFLPVYRIRDP